MTSNEESDSVREYAKCTFALKQARKRCLENLGISEEGLRKLHDEALILMGTDEIETEYGQLQKIPDLPIQYHQHRLKDGQLIAGKPFKMRLRLNIKESK